MHIKLGVAAARIGRELEVAGLPPAFVDLAASGQAPPDQLQGGDQAELAYYREFGPAATPVAEPVRVAGMRWAIKAGFAEAKGAVGLDHDEVRTWTAWYRRVTLALLAHAHLQVVRLQADGDERQKGDRPTCSR